jgi:membrane protein DedA with SNARE-associated domain
MDGIGVMYWLLALSMIIVHIAWPHLTIGALITLQTLQHALRVLGYPAVSLFIMIESTGIPFPGETMLLFASFYAAIDHQLNIVIVIACAALGAIVGDNLGYLIGRSGGRALVRRYGRFVFLKPQHLEQAEKFFAKHGDKTVFFGRFIAILRAWAAFLAGLNHMHWRTFLIYNATGGIVWATIYGLLGYEAGHLFHDNFAAVQRIARDIGWIGIIIIAAIIIAAYIIFRVRRAHEHTDKAQPAPKTTRPLPESNGVGGTSAPPNSAKRDEAKRH